MGSSCKCGLWGLGFDGVELGQFLSVLMFLDLRNTKNNSEKCKGQSLLTFGAAYQMTCGISHCNVQPGVP